MEAAAGAASDASLYLSDSPEKPSESRTTARSRSTIRIGRSQSSRGSKRHVSSGGRVAAARQAPKMPVSRSPMRRPRGTPDWLPRAVHRRVERNLELAAPGINEQFEADREQIAMLRNAVEGLHGMVMMQESAYTDLRGQVQELQHLDHQARQRQREVGASIEDLQNKLTITGGVVQRNFEEIRNRINDPGDEWQKRVEKIEADLHSLGAMFLQKVARDGEVENYLMEVEGKKPQEGEANIRALKYLHGELNGLKQQFITHTGTTAGIINSIAQKNLSDDELGRLGEMEMKVNHMYPVHLQGDQNLSMTQQRLQAIEGRLDHCEFAAAPCGHGHGFPGHPHGHHGPPQGPGGSQDGLPLFVTLQHGGNGACHCKQVVQLEGRVGALERAGPSHGAQGSAASSRRPNFTNMFIPGASDAMVEEEIAEMEPLRRRRQSSNRLDRSGSSTTRRSSSTTTS